MNLPPEQRQRPKLKSSFIIPVRSSYHPANSNPPRRSNAYESTLPRRHIAGREQGASKAEDSLWTPVRRWHWWRREQHSSEAQRLQISSRGQRPHSSRRGERPSHLPISAAHRAFWAETSGKCFICLAKDHRAAQCRDPIHCFTCRRSGHRARECRCADSPSSRALATGCPRAGPSPSCLTAPTQKHRLATNAQQRRLTTPTHQRHPDTPICCYPATNSPSPHCFADTFHPYSPGHRRCHPATAYQVNIHDNGAAR